MASPPQAAARREVAAEREVGMIEFRNVAKVFSDGTVALRQVTLSVPRGQFCVILGPSGAGKSTLLRMLNGMTDPSAGRVSIDGFAMGRRNRRKIQARVAMIHQQFNLIHRLSVLDNVLAGALREVPLPAALFCWFPERLRRRACYLLDMVGRGLERVGQDIWPPVFSERTSTTRIEGFDPANLPRFARVETVEIREPKLNPETFQMEETVASQEMLVEPFGYLARVILKMLESIEIALWGTILAVLVSTPLAFFGARNYSPCGFTYFLARSSVSFLRAVPAGSARS